MEIIDNAAHTFHHFSDAMYIFPHAFLLTLQILVAMSQFIHKHFTKSFCFCSKKDIFSIKQEIGIVELYHCSRHSSIKYVCGSLSYHCKRFEREREAGEETLGVHRYVLKYIHLFRFITQSIIGPPAEYFLFKQMCTGLLFKV